MSMFRRIFGSGNSPRSFPFRQVVHSDVCGIAKVKEVYYKDGTFAGYLPSITVGFVGSLSTFYGEHPFPTKEEAQAVADAELEIHVKQMNAVITRRLAMEIEQGYFVIAVRGSDASE